MHFETQNNSAGRAGFIKTMPSNRCLSVCLITSLTSNRLRFFLSHSEHLSGSIHVSIEVMISRLRGVNRRSCTRVSLGIWRIVFTERAHFDLGPPKLLYHFSLPRPLHTFSPSSTGLLSSGPKRASLPSHGYFAGVAFAFAHFCLSVCVCVAWLDRPRALEKRLLRSSSSSSRVCGGGGSGHARSIHE